MKKHWQKFLAASLVAGTLTFAPAIYSAENFSAVYAEIKLYTASGEDYPSEVESQDISKQRALDKAVKKATEQAGVYLKSYSRTINSELSDDEITAITCNAYEIVGEPQFTRTVKQISDETSIVVWKVTVEVNVDDAEVTKWLQRDSNDKSAVLSQTQETLKLSAENDETVEELRRRADKVTDDAERTQLKAEFAQVDKQFLYNKKIADGNKYLFNGYNNAALESFSEAIQIDPNNARAYSCRAYAYEKIGKLDAAVDDISKAIELEPKTSCYSTRAYLYCKLKQYDNALADFNKMIELEPKDSHGYSGRAYVYKALNRKEDAVAEYDRAIKLNPDNAFLYHSRAALHKELKQYDKALADLTKYTELAADAVAFNRRDAYKERANLYKELKQYDNALADLTECIKLETDDENKAEAYDNRGDFYRYTLNQPDKANADYEQAVKLYTKIINSSADKAKLKSCYYSRALLYKQLEQYDKALDDYTSRINLDTRDALSYSSRGGLYKELKRHDAAVADYEKAIDLEPGNKWNYKELGELHEDLKQYDKAVEFYDKMIEINPHDSSGYIWRGGAYRKLKQFDKAIADYTKAIELEPHNASCYKYRGKCYEALGEMAKAQADFAKADELKRK